MAKFKALRNFKGYKEKRMFKKGEEFDMTVKRATELQANVDKKFPGTGEVMERIVEEEAPEEAEAEAVEEEEEETDEGGE